MATDGRQELQYISTVTQATLRFTTTMTGVVLQALQAAEKSDPVAKALSDSFRNGNAYFRLVNLGEQDAIRNLLEQNGIIAVSTTYGDQGCVMFQASDREKADLIIDDYLMQQSMGGLVGSKQAFNHYAQNQVQEIKGVDYPTTQLFVNRCEQQHLPVMVEGPTNGRYAIRFAARDKEAMDRIQMNVATMMASPAAKVIQKQLNWQEKNHVAVTNAVINQRDFADRQLPEGSMVVDMSGKSLRVDAHTLVMENDVEKMTLSKKRINTRAGQTQLQDFVVGMQEPVLLNPQQAAQYKKLKPEQQRDFLIQVEREQGRPVLSQTEQEALAQTIKQRARVEQKLEMEHPNTSQSPYTEYNDVQDLVGFKNEERQAFEVTHDISEGTHPDANILNDSRAENTGLDGGWTEEAKRFYAELEADEMEQGLLPEIQAEKVLGGYTAELTEDEPVVNLGDTRNVGDMLQDFDDLSEPGE